MESLRLVFAGTPAFAAAHLQAVLQSRHEVVAVYTQPDRPAGRGKKIQPGPVKQLAQSAGLPVVQPSSLKSEQQRSQLASLNADVMVVVAYGLILPESILDVPRLGCINVHASLLPRWRGAAPIERALLAGDKETGVTIMQMDAGLDTGDMLLVKTVPILEQDDRETLEDKLKDIGSLALVETLDNLSELQQHATSQDDANSTYAAKLEKSEALINWSQPAAEINRLVRAGVGRFPAYTELSGLRIRVLHAEPVSQSYSVAPGAIIENEAPATKRNRVIRVACADSSLDIDRVQLPGKTPVNVNDLLNSRPELFAAGKSFDTPKEPSTS